MTNINWSNIAQATEFYQAHGFEYIETPWIADYDTLAFTCSDVDRIITVDDNKGLVGSAEQGFMQLAIDGKLPHVNYVSAGPCFRVEEYDELHQPQFFKVELFTLCNADNAAYAANELLNRAWKFMKCVPNKVQTDDGFDLEINGIEVGSYGTRYHELIGWWAYGTGLAEPRYTLALSQSTS